MDKIEAKIEAQITPVAEQAPKAAKEIKEAPKEITQTPKEAKNGTDAQKATKEVKVEGKAPVKIVPKTDPVKESHPEVKPFFIKKKSQFSDYKLFNKWSFSDVIITDPSLVKYMNIDPIVIPHSFGRKTQGRFEKANLNVVERLVNKIMRSGQGKRKLSGKFIRGRGSCGKKMEAIQIVEGAFDIIEKQKKQNPIQVLVKAIENSAPREDVTRIKRGGVAYSLAVDVSPLKRLDESIKNIALGGFGGSFNKKVSASQALAEEIIAASANDIKSSAIKRKDEVERIAKASR